MVYDGSQTHQETPKPKSQTPIKLQIPNPKFPASLPNTLELGIWIFSGAWSLEFGAWEFFGIWDLGFGIFISLSHPQFPQSSTSPSFSHPSPPCALPPHLRK